MLPLPVRGDNRQLQKYFELIRHSLGDRGVRRMRHLLDRIYPDVDFRGKRVLDIGGGAGLHSFYAAAMGADEVVNLEPEAAGSTAGVRAPFEEWREGLGLTQTLLVEETLENYERSEPFDVVLLINSINHFDEAACARLPEDEESVAAYSAQFAKIATLCAADGTVVLTDCSPSNFFAKFGIRNPFDPNIEWQKHQPPTVWSSLLEQHGFRVTSLRWSTPSKLGALGRALFGNRVSAFFFTSHFVLTLRKDGSPG